MGMKRTFVACSVLFGTASMSLSQSDPRVECPVPLPDRASLPQIISCLQQLQVSAIPAGAVVAFDRADGCPGGWVDVGESAPDQFAGRVLVVAGPATKRTPERASTSERPRDSQGGEENVVLTEEHLPQHDHSTGIFNQLLGKTGRDTYDYTVEGPPSGPSLGEAFPMAPVGGDQAHNNMPPFIALTMCKKE